jgi:hypothetical protein
VADALHNFDANEIAEAVLRGMDRGLSRLALTLQTTIKVSISGAGTGVRYPRSLRPSSRPGEPPAKQTGDLSRSWQGAPNRIATGRRLGYRIGSNKKYAAALEYGTARMDARPYVQPAIDKIAPQAVQILSDYVNEQIRKLNLGRL